jgi:peptidylprolyl isomerase
MSSSKSIRLDCCVGRRLLALAVRKRWILLAALVFAACSGKDSIEGVGDASARAAPSVPPDVNAIPANATKTDSGLAYRILQVGSGDKHPAPTDQVQVHYSGWTTDGVMFDSSLVRGEPITFSLQSVIKGWTEGVQLMIEGEKTRFWIPAELAYGATPGRPGRPAGMLVFDIELLKIL